MAHVPSIRPPATRNLMTPREPIIKPRSKTALPASLYPSSVCRRQAEAVIRRLLEMDDADIPEVVAGPPACAHAMTKAISPGQLSLISGAIGRLDFIVDSSVEYKGYQLVGSDEMLTVVSVPARRFLWVIDWPRLAGDLRSTFITAISQPESRIVFIGNAGPMDPATLRLLAKHGIESELRACTHWHHAAPGTQPGVGDPTIGHRIFYCEGPGQPARLSMRHEASVRRLIRRRLALQLQAGGQRADNSKRRLDDLVDRCLRPPLPLGTRRIHVRPVPCTVLTPTVARPLRASQFRTPTLSGLTRCSGFAGTTVIVRFVPRPDHRALRSRVLSVTFGTCSGDSFTAYIPTQTKLGVLTCRPCSTCSLT